MLALLLMIYGARHVTRSMGDFKVYHRAAKRAVAGQSLYRLEDPDRYLYAPVVTFLFLPLAIVPPLAGKIAWFALNIALVASVLRSTAALLFREGRAPPGFYALVLALSLRFIDNNLGHGQLNILLLWLVLRAYVRAGEGRYPLAGFALAAAIAAKIVPAVLLIQVVLRRQWRFAAWTVIAFVTLMVVPVVWWGRGYPALVEDWLRVVADQAGHYEMGNKINQSIAAFVYRLFQPSPQAAPLAELSQSMVAALTIAVHAFFLFPLVTLSLRLSRLAPDDPQRPNGDELSLYLLYSTVASPYSWKYYFVNLLFPFGAAVRRLWSAKRRETATALWAVFALNFFAGLELLGKRLATAFQLASFHFLAVVVLFVLVACAAFRDAGRRRGASPSSGTLC